MASTARSTQERLAERQAANDAFYSAQEEEREQRRAYVANRMAAERNRRTRMDGTDMPPSLRIAVDRLDEMASDNELNDLLSDKMRQRRDDMRERAERYSRFRKKSKLARGADAFKLALEHRKAIEEGEFSVFLVPFVLAVVKDGIIDTTIGNIPALGWILEPVFGLPITIYLIVFSWGRGVWKVRIIIMILSFLDYIPVVDLLPMSTIGVAWIFIWAVDHAKIAKAEVAKLEKVMQEDGDKRWYNKWASTV